MNVLYKLLCLLFFELLRRVYLLLKNKVSLFSLSFFSLIFIKMDPSYPYYPSHTDHVERTVPGNRGSTLLLATEPKDLDKLFDRSTIEVERDICFPTTNKRATTRSMSSDTTTAPMTPNKINNSRNNSINVNALSSWFTDIDMYSTANYKPLTKQVKKLSLYGDNHQSIIQDSKEDRYMYYHPETGVIRGRSLLELRVPPQLTVDQLLMKENYWIDFTSPSLAEMKAISKVKFIYNVIYQTKEFSPLDFSHSPAYYRRYYGP